ncbi:DUF4279 domain-containing protein [Streptomyces sp. NPDC053493]|uniref:DUF4279 domain-containing protein n=1 Tax=Streptomyces sp. NPDC053493 TaxID=3365705 RepID=UPI0037D77656
MDAERQDGARWTLTSVALVVRGPELDPEALTARLGLEPTGTRPPGPSRWGRPGDVDGEWRLQCDERTARAFAAQLDTVLAAAEPHRESWRALTAEGLSVSLVVRGYVDNDAQLALSVAQMRRVADLGLPLTLTPSTSER